MVIRLVGIGEYSRKVIFSGKREESARRGSPIISSSPYSRSVDRYKRVVGFLMHADTGSK